MDENVYDDHSTSLTLFFYTWQVDNHRADHVSLHQSHRSVSFTPSRFVSRIFSSLFHPTWSESLYACVSIYTSRMSSLINRALRRSGFHGNESHHADTVLRFTGFSQSSSSGNLPSPWSPLIYFAFLLRTDEQKTTTDFLVVSDIQSNDQPFLHAVLAGHDPLRHGTMGAMFGDEHLLSSHLSCHLFSVGLHSISLSTDSSSDDAGHDWCSHALDEWPQLRFSLSIHLCVCVLFIRCERKDFVGHTPIDNDHEGLSKERSVVCLVLTSKGEWGHKKFDFSRFVLCKDHGHWLGTDLQQSWNVQSRRRSDGTIEIDHHQQSRRSHRSVPCHHQRHALRRGL